MKHFNNAFAEKYRKSLLLRGIVERRKKERGNTYLEDKEMSTLALLLFTMSSLIAIGVISFVILLIL